jgi:GTP cyclohydrolase I
VARRWVELGATEVDADLHDDGEGVKVADVDDDRDSVSDTDEELLRVRVRVERGVVDMLGLTVSVREPEPVTLEVVLRERVRVDAGELDALLDEVEGRMRGVLESLVIDTEGDHNTQDTARRVAKMYLTEVFRGRYAEAPPVTEFPNAESLNELMIVGPITVRSACSHHFCPIMGRLWIGLMPNEHSNLIGLSKYSRLADWVMSRPQIQEEAITQMAELLMDKVRPDGLAIVMEADHFCMHWRGVKDSETKMINSVMRGSFLKDKHLRSEFLSLLQQRK